MSQQEAQHLLSTSGNVQETIQPQWKKFCVDFVHSRPCTVSIAGVCLATYLVGSLLWKGTIDTYGPLSAYLVVQKLQVWRVLTYCILHANMIHLLFNMIALFQLGFLMEVRMGPKGFLKAIMIINLVSVAVYCLLCYALDFATSGSSFTTTMTVGFSGILFGLLGIESIRGGISQATKVSLYGIVNVPKYAVPWCLVAIIYVVIPSSSLIGHISGIMSGYFFRLMCFNRDDDFVDEDWVLGQYISGS